jgi:hypothetical protein
VDPDRSSIDRRKSTSADVWLDVGLRPVFHFDERFTLETSLGVRVRRDHSETAESSTDTANLSTSTRSAKYEGTSWTVGVFGRDLGLAATMAFMIYL